ncbi:HDR052Cp [Eremothecium sinecaudum]|uniref:HDR052Cp n=1 Tax=Eremothecium sinecaudum TaxID=45286 RepID=A0A0X8HSS7_9SACH|nr:HDR052Cp [Eremothecium sinecaudum]AMD20794.1 HDR052Cp [Eremothecium sinecaudum]
MPHPVISLKPSYNSIIRGCPGIPETLPRMEFELRIRSNDGKPFIVEKIQVSLVTTEALAGSGPSFTSKGKLEMETVNYKKNIRVTSKRIVGVDIPLTIAIPDNIKETNYNKFGQTYTEFRCRVQYVLHRPKGSSNDYVPLSETLSTIVNIEKYNLIASPQLFPPLTRKVLSPNKKFEVQYCIKTPCLTMEDVLDIELEILPNLAKLYGPSYSQKLFNKRLKLKSIVLELKEYLEVHDSRVVSKEHTLVSELYPFNNVIGDSGISLSTSLTVSTGIPLFSKFLKSLGEPISATISEIQPNLDDKSIPEVVILKSKNSKSKELQTHCSITTRGRLFSISHGLSMKFKISNGKDFEIKQPLDISPWSKADINIVEQCIRKELGVAKNALNFYNTFGGIGYNKKTGITEYPPLHCVIYMPDKETLNDLGVYYTSEHKNAQRIPIIE